ncbi:MAG TPA: nucleoside triphosphate pyrophosphohydrolase [Thermoanaerobaculia bacterium]|nr:nucleoside triphosphate pyrophosphohydrolase [Thermoanaerobaculia bacterium]
MPAPDLQKLLDLVARLRAPDGCPWDREQSLGDVRAYLLEEAHEAAGAIDSGDWNEVAAELGDLLFQVAFIGRLAEEAGAFDLSQAIEAVHTKMVARHPHVFGSEEDRNSLSDAQAVREAWERRKVKKDPNRSVLAGVSASLPALLSSYRLTQKAAGVGFDWPDAVSVLDKIDEELAELRGALGDGNDPQDRAAVSEELGDLLFTLANLGRKLDLDPEAALAQANLKFRRRFESIEAGLASAGKSPADATLDEMDALWGEAKRSGL